MKLRSWAGRSSSSLGKAADVEPYLAIMTAALALEAKLVLPLWLLVIANRGEWWKGVEVVGEKCAVCLDCLFVKTRVPSWAVRYHWAPHRTEPFDIMSRSIFRTENIELENTTASQHGTVLALWSTYTTPRKKLVKLWATVWRVWTTFETSNFNFWRSRWMYTLGKSSLQLYTLGKSSLVYLPHSRNKM